MDTNCLETVLFFKFRRKTSAVFYMLRKLYDSRCFYKSHKNCLQNVKKEQSKAGFFKTTKFLHTATENSTTPFGSFNILKVEGFFT